MVFTRIQLQVTGQSSAGVKVGTLHLRYQILRYPEPRGCGMKRWLIVLALLFLGHDLFAGVSCSVPFNLTNGSNADASQVMANYNAILSCLLNNTVESGANSSITPLSGLTTPLSRGQGGFLFTQQEPQEHPALMR